MSDNIKKTTTAQEILDKKIESAKLQKEEIKKNLMSKDYLVTVFETGDQTMSTGDHERQDVPRRTYQVASLLDLPDIIGKMQIGYWRHPDLKEDLSNAEEIPFEEKMWGIYAGVIIEPFTKELEQSYLDKSKEGFFEKYRGFEKRKESFDE